MAKIAASLPQLSDEHVQALAELAARWTDDDAGAAVEDEASRAAIANGVAQARRGEFATDEEVAEVYKRFRK